MQEFIQIWKTNVVRYNCHPIAEKREESNLSATMIYYNHVLRQGRDGGRWVKTEGTIQQFLLTESVWTFLTVRLCTHLTNNFGNRTQGFQH
jgi:hypothetical protein